MRHISFSPVESTQRAELESEGQNFQFEISACCLSLTHFVCDKSCFFYNNINSSFWRALLETV